MNFKMFNKFNALLLAGAMLVSVVACSDYDDDIAGLSDRLESLEGSTVTIESLASQLEAIELTIPDVSQLNEDVTALLADVEGLGVDELSGSISDELDALEASLKEYVQSEDASTLATVEATYETIETVNGINSRLAIIEAYFSGFADSEYADIVSSLNALQDQIVDLTGTIATWTSDDLDKYLTAEGYATEDFVTEQGYATKDYVDGLFDGLSILDNDAVNDLIAAYDFEYDYCTLDAVSKVGYLTSLDGAILSSELGDYESLEAYVNSLITAAIKDITSCDCGDDLDNYKTEQATYQAYLTELLGYSLTEEEDGTFTVASSVLSDLEDRISTLEDDYKELESRVSALETSVAALKAVISEVQSLVYVPSTVMEYDWVYFGEIYYINWSNDRSTLLPLVDAPKTMLRFRSTPTTVASALAELWDSYGDDEKLSFMETLNIVDEEVAFTKATGIEGVEESSFTIVGFELLNEETGLFAIHVELNDADMAATIENGETYGFAVNIKREAEGDDYLTDFLIAQCEAEDIDANDLIYAPKSGNLVDVENRRGLLLESHELKYTEAGVDVMFFDPANYTLFYDQTELSTLVDWEGIIEVNTYKMDDEDFTKVSDNEFGNPSGDQYTNDPDVDYYTLADTYMNILVVDPITIDDAVKSPRFQFVVSLCEDVDMPSEDEIFDPEGDVTPEDYVRPEFPVSAVLGEGLSVVKINTDGIDVVLENIGVADETISSDNGTISERIIMWVYDTEVDVRVVEVRGVYNTDEEVIELTADQFNGLFATTGSTLYTGDPTYTLTNIETKEDAYTTGMALFGYESPVYQVGDPQSVTVDFASLPASGTYELKAVYVMDDKTTITVTVPQIVVIGEPDIASLDLEVSLSNFESLVSTDYRYIFGLSQGIINGSQYRFNLGVYNAETGDLPAALYALIEDTDVSSQFESATEFAAYLTSLVDGVTHDTDSKVAFTVGAGVNFASSTFMAKYVYDSTTGTVDYDEEYYDEDKDEVVYQNAWATAEYTANGETIVTIKAKIALYNDLSGVITPVSAYIDGSDGVWTGTANDADNYSLTTLFYATVAKGQEGLTATLGYAFTDAQQTKINTFLADFDEISFTEPTIEDGVLSWGDWYENTLELNVYLYLNGILVDTDVLTVTASADDSTPWVPVDLIAATGIVPTGDYGDSYTLYASEGAVDNYIGESILNAVDLKADGLVFGFVIDGEVNYDINGETPMALNNAYAATITYEGYTATYDNDTTVPEIDLKVLFGDTYLYENAIAGNGVQYINTADITVWNDVTLTYTWTYSYNFYTGSGYTADLIALKGSVSIPIVVTVTLTEEE